MLSDNAAIEQSFNEHLHTAIQIYMHTLSEKLAEDAFKFYMSEDIAKHCRESVPEEEWKDMYSTMLSEVMDDFKNLNL